MDAGREESESRNGDQNSMLLETSAPADCSRLCKRLQSPSAHSDAANDSATDVDNGVKFMKPCPAPLFGRGV